MMQTEVEVAVALKAYLDAGIAASLALAETYTEPYTDEQLKEVQFSRTSVILDIDELENLIDNSDPTNVISTPVILIELDITGSDTNSNLGTRIYGHTNYSMTVMVYKEGRVWTEYKKEVVNITNKAMDTFGLQTGKMIKIGDTAWTDGPIGGVKTSGSVTTITTSVNNYDYSLT